MQLRKIVSADVVAAMLDITADELIELIYLPASGRPDDHVLPDVADLVERLPRPIHMCCENLLWFEDELIQWQRKLAKAREIERRSRHRQRRERVEQEQADADRSAAEPVEAVM